MSNYNPDKKIEACKKFLKSGASYERFAKHLGVSNVTLRKWIKEYISLGENAFINLKSNQDEIIKSLKKENKELKKIVEEQKIRDEMYSDLRRVIKEKK